MLCAIGQGRPLATAGCPVAGGWPVLEALSRYVSPQLVQEVLELTGRQSLRVRKLPAAAMVWLMLVMGLRSDLDIPAMWRQVCGTMASLLLAIAGGKPPTKSALSQARARLGPRPLRQLFLQTGRPMATLQTRGATYKGMPLKAMDGDDYKIPDTPANAKAFGRPTTRRKGQELLAGYPQFHLNRLIEVGTRLCIEALIKPNHFNDHASAPRLLAAAEAGDLVLWDAGFYSFKLMKQAMDESKFFLGPVPCHVVLEPVERLGDGSYLAWIYPIDKNRRRVQKGILVRVLEYTFDEPARTGHGERHRLITNLLDAQKHPTKELIVLYHERWEIELDNDEITTHQLDRAVELRSRTPVGVVQEIYAVLASHNAIRALMHESALSIDIDPRKLSFMHALRVIRDTIPLMRNARTPSLPMLYRSMIASIALGVLPPRDGRINPRVVKVIRPSNFPVKKPQHYHMPPLQKNFLDSLVLLN
jgi:hypothetical protein